MESSVLIAPQLCAAAALDLRPHSFDTHLDPYDAALYALTDFQREPPITIGPGRLIVDAFDDMNRLEVHALLVTSERPQDGHVITGLITAADITQRLHGRAAVGLTVGDVMTSVDDLPLVHYESLESLTAADLYSMFQGTGLTHLLVMEHGEGDEGQPIARGLLSRNSLGVRLHSPTPQLLHG